MKIALVGLGRMGSGMAKRLSERGHECIVHDRDFGRLKEFIARPRITVCESIEEIPKSLEPPRAVWLMLPAGEVTATIVNRLGGLLSPGDIILDGGNGYYGDDIKRARDLGRTGVHYMDVGVSGGIWGEKRGYSLMVGGEEEQFRFLEPVFRALADGSSERRATGQERTAPLGYLYCGSAGAGHFSKMIHNGIEYGMMQALAEGFDLLAASEYKPDLAELAEVWRHGSVVSSWLLDLVAASLREDPQLSRFEGRVPDSGEGRWALETAVNSGVPAPVLAAALFVRFRSRRSESFSEKLLSAMRSQFGGHTEG